MDKERREGASNPWIDEEEGDVVWWDWKGIVHYELLSSNQTINSEVYCEQLQRLQQAIERKRLELINRRDVVFHQQRRSTTHIFDNRQKLRELDWEVLMHPPYSPDIASSDYHLFRSLQNSLNDIKLASKEACENHLKYFSIRNHRILSRWNYGSAPKMAKYYRK